MDFNKKVINTLHETVRCKFWKTEGSVKSIIPKLKHL